MSRLFQQVQEIQRNAATEAVPTIAEQHADTRAAQLAAEPAGGPVLVAFVVPDTPLQFGEHLRLCGSSEALGGWDATAGVTLAWSEGNTWTAEVALAPGSHSFKLLCMRSDGTAHWEAGPDRTVSVPAVGDLPSVAAAPAVMAVCRWLDTAATALRPVEAVQAQINVRWGAAGWEMWRPTPAGCMGPACLPCMGVQ